MQSGIRRSDRRGPAASAERYSGTGSGSAQFDGQAAARPDGSADDSCGRFGGTCHPYSRSDGNGDSDCNPIAGTFGYPVPYRSTARISIKYAVSNSETRSDSYRHSCPCAAAYAAAGTDSDANTQPFAHSDPDADPIAIAFSNP